MTGSFLHGLARNQVSRDCQEPCVTGVILVFWTVWSGRERIMSNSYSSERGSRRPLVPKGLAGDEPALSEIARQFVERTRGEGIELTGQGGCCRRWSPTS